MESWFFVLVEIFALLIFGLFVYLILLPIKSFLRKKGKLSTKTNKKINIYSVVILFIVGILLFYFKDYRTSSKSRIEKISDIKLPKNFNLIKDQYQDMLQDYAIIYKIDFDKNETKELIRSIKSSKYYNSINLWKNKNNGFEFYKEEKNTTYRIQIDTLKNTLSYEEIAD